MTLLALLSMFNVRRVPERDDPFRVHATQFFGVGALVEALGRVLADRLEHRVAAAVAADEALVDERVEEVGVGIRTSLGRVERPAAGEDREPANSCCSAVSRS